MEKINLTAEAYVALGINQDADAAVLSASIVKLHQDNSKAQETIGKLQTQIDKGKKARAEALVKLAVDAGRINADDRAGFVELAMSNYELAEKTLSAIPDKVQLSAVVTKISGGVIPSDRQNWTYLKWLKEDPEGLAKIKAENCEAFDAIKKVRN